MAIIGKEWEASLQKQNRKTNPFLTQTLYTLNPSQRTLRKSEVYREWQASEYTGHRQLLRGRNIRCHETIDCSVIFNSVQLLSHDRLFATPWTTTCQASLSNTTPRVYSNSCPLSWWCHPTISSSVIPSPPAFNLSQHQSLSNDSVLPIRWPKYWAFQLQHQSFQWIFWVDFL